MNGIWIGLGAGALLWIIWRSSLCVRICYEKSAQRDRFQLQVLLFGWLKVYQLEREQVLQALLADQLNMLWRGGTEAAAKRAGNIFGRKALGRVNYTKLFLLRFVCRTFCCRIQVAAGDAAATALGCGIAQALTRLALCWLRRRARFERRPEIAIAPHFCGGHSEVLFQCILAIRIGHIIATLKKLYWEDKYE